MMFRLDFLSLVVTLYILEVNCFIDNVYITQSQAKSAFRICQSKNSEAIGSAFEYTGPMTGGVPAEIAAMFNLKKGRKLKKGDNNFRRKSSSSGKNKAETSDDDNIKEDSREFGLNELERQVISKYGSKTVKESVLSPLDDEDRLMQEQRMSSRARFEGFGAKKPSPAREAFQGLADTKRSTKNYNKDLSDDLSEDEIREALFKGSKTMSQYATSSSKSKTMSADSTPSTMLQSNDDSRINKKSSTGRRHWDFSTTFPTAIDVDESDEQKNSVTSTNQNVNRYSERYSDRPPSKSQQALREPLKPEDKISKKSKKSKFQPFFKDDVEEEKNDDDDDDDDYDDDDDDDDDEDDFANGLKSTSFSSSPTSNQPSSSFSVNTKSVDKVRHEVQSVEDLFEDDYDDYTNYERVVDDVDDIYQDRSGKPSSKNIRAKSSSSSSQLRSPSPLTPPPPPPAAPVMYRLRAPAVPTAEENMKLIEKQQKLQKMEELKTQKRQEKKLLEKNEFFPFQFDSYINNDENGSSDSKMLVNYEDNKLFSKTVTDFAELGVSNEGLLNNLRERFRIEIPTRIQELSIPFMMQGYDVVMQSHTGSGKTLAFLLPMVQYIDPYTSKIQAIVLASSRELVIQIGQVAEMLYNNTGIKIQTLIGGANVQNQIEKLKQLRPHIIVATPGRLAELVFKLEKIKLSQVRMVVIDEADHMLCEPYVAELETILESIPMFRQRGNRIATAATDTPTIGSKPMNNDEELESSGNYIENDADNNSNNRDNREEMTDETEALSQPMQSLLNQKETLICLASATSIDNVAVNNFVSKYMLANQWKSVAVDKTQLLPPTITHALISIPRIRALEMLKKFLNSKPIITSAIIFVNDAYRVQIVCDQLLEMNVIATPLAGESSKDERKDVLSKLRSGQIKLVVSTELAARGLDIPDLSHVVNFDLPTDCQHYIHRAGRCGRAGRQGLVMNFANTDTKFVVRRFGKQLNVKIMDCEIRNGEVFLKKR